MVNVYFILLYLYFNLFNVSRVFFFIQAYTFEAIVLLISRQEWRSDFSAVALVVNNCNMGLLGRPMIYEGNEYPFSKCFCQMRDVVRNSTMRRSTFSTSFGKKSVRLPNSSKFQLLSIVYLFMNKY